MQGKAGSTLPWEWKQEVEALQGWFEVTALDQTVWRAKQSLGKTSFLYRYHKGPQMLVVSAGSPVTFISGSEPKSEFRIGCILVAWYWNEHMSGHYIEPQAGPVQEHKKLP